MKKSSFFKTSSTCQDLVALEQRFSHLSMTPEDEATDSAETEDKRDKFVSTTPINTPLQEPIEPPAQDFSRLSLFDQLDAKRRQHLSQSPQTYPKSEPSDPEFPESPCSLPFPMEDIN